MSLLNHRSLPKIVLAAAAAFSMAASHAAIAQTPFYVPDRQELAGSPGTIIRAEPMRGAPEGAAAYRVLYRSTGLHDEPIAVSGVVVIPAGAAPVGGRPIIAWAHPTTGVVPRCAPSRALFVFQQMQGLRAMVKRGYVVTATDYPGLGTAGPHPYLVGASEARAVLDAVRAAREMPGAGGGRHFAAWGHSQGGQAVLFTGIIAANYAPELELVGVAAAAPATELATLMTEDLASNGGRNLTAMTLWSWARVFSAPMERVLKPQAIPVVNKLAEECIESIYDLVVRRRTARPLMQMFLSVPNPVDVEPWRSLAAENTPGLLPRKMPIFLSQGTDDQLVRPDVTKDYMAKLCRAGSRVSVVMLPSVDHGFIARDSANDAVNWMAGRFAGDAAPSDCSRQ
jgi:alpha-beta hydrolase superfamily lysophospholipase